MHEVRGFEVEKCVFSKGKDKPGAGEEEFYILSPKTEEEGFYTMSLVAGETQGGISTLRIRKDETKSGISTLRIGKIQATLTFIGLVASTEKSSLFIEVKFGLRP